MRAALSGGWLGGAAEALDRHDRGRLALAVENGVAHQEHGRVLRHRQPVARLALAAHQHLKRPVGIHLQIRRVQLSGRGERAVHGIAIRLGTEGQVAHRATRAAQPVLAVAGDGGVPVDVVGVVTADLEGGVRGLVENREVRVAELEHHLERHAGQARQVAPAFRPIEFRGRRLRSQHFRAAALSASQNLSHEAPLITRATTSSSDMLGSQVGERSRPTSGSSRPLRPVKTKGGIVPRPRSRAAAHSSADDRAVERARRCLVQRTKTVTAR